MAIDLRPYAEPIDNALAEGAICAVATNGAGGPPDIGLKGSMLVFDQDHLAYWERTRGQLLANLRRDPRIAVLYFNRERRRYVRLFGEARLYEEGPLREAIMGRVIEGELSFDPQRKGIGVLIRVDRLEEPFAGVSQRREDAEGA